MSADVVGALGVAIKGLLYMSETDAPFEVVQWPKLGSTITSNDVLAVLGKKMGVQADEATLDNFFTELTQEQDWHDETTKQVVQRYRQLRMVLQQNLTGLRVFRIGQVRIEIYIVGRSSAEDWAGIKTTAVET